MSTNLAEIINEFEEQKFQEEISAIATDEEAEKIMQKIAWVAKKKAEKQSQYDEQIDFLNRKKAVADEWLQKELESLNGYSASLESQLRPYIEKKLDGKKTRSIKFINGKAGLRKGTEKFYIANQEVKNDNPKLIEIVKTYNESLIKTKEIADWASFKKTLNVTDSGKVVNADGEIIQDMEVICSEDKFYVEVN